MLKNMWTDTHEEDSNVGQSGDQYIQTMFWNFGSCDFRDNGKFVSQYHSLHIFGKHACVSLYMSVSASVFVCILASLRVCVCKFVTRLCARLC